MKVLMMLVLTLGISVGETQEEFTKRVLAQNEQWLKDAKAAEAAMTPEQKQAKAEAQAAQVEEDKKKEAVRRNQEINAAAWELVKKEFPRLVQSKEAQAHTLQWMKKWDEYYKVNDPDLASNPARPILYARMNQANIEEARRQAAVEYELSGRRAMDENTIAMKAQAQEIQRQTQAIEKQKAAIEAAREEQERETRKIRQELEDLSWR